MITFHEGLYYADAKTRITPESPWLQHDTHLHAYVYPVDTNNGRTRTDGFKDGVAREIGDKVYG